MCWSIRTIGSPVSWTGPPPRWVIPRGTWPCSTRWRRRPRSTGPSRCTGRPAGGCGPGWSSPGWSSPGRSSPGRSSTVRGCGPPHRSAMRCSPCRPATRRTGPRPRRDSTTWRRGDNPHSHLEQNSNFVTLEAMTELVETPQDARRDTPDALPLGPDSLVWRYFGDNRMPLIGPRPAVLQNMLAELGQGVLDHSVFFSDTAARVRRSLPPIFMTVYGSDDENPGRQVRDYHTEIKGTMP